MSPDVRAAAAVRLAGYAAWIEAWTPAVPLRWLLRHRLAGAAVLAAAVAVLVAAAAVHADNGTGEGASGGNALISWMGITDSHGVPVAKYTLTLNKGGWNEPAQAGFAYLASFVYELMLCVVATALWLIRTVLGFGWLTLFAEPFATIGSGITTAMDRYGLAPTALAILAIIAVFTVLAGKAAKAVSHIAMGLLMVGMAATIFAHPLSQMIGPDGLLAEGRQTGLAIASTISGGKQISDPDELVSSLADRFLRSPTQMINFGRVSDSISRKCEQAWSNGINQGRGDELKDDMQGCDRKAGADMHAKSMSSPVPILVSVVMVGLLGGLLIAFALFFVWHVIRTAVHALLYAALAPPAFAIGVIPGGPQMFAWKTVLDCLCAYAAMIIYTGGFGGYNAILDRVFASTGNAIEAIFLTALVLGFGFAFFGPLRGMFNRHRDTMAAKISRGGGTSSGGGGSGKIGQFADLARLKSEIGQQFGWNDLRRGKSGSRGAGGRGPTRIEAETGSGADPAPQAGNGADGGGGGGGGETAPGEPSAQASNVRGGETGHDLAAVGETHTGSGRAHSAAAGSAAAPRTTGQPVSFYGSDERAAAHDRLAALHRMQRGAGSRPGPGPGGGGGGRYSLSEAA